MNYKKIFVGTVCALSALSAINAYAEGNPEYVKFPTGYETSFANYTTMNRDGKEQVAKMYANDAAISSYKKGQTAAPGSVVVMEVYKPKKDADGKSIVGSDGIYEIGKLAAVAVMERRDAWEAAYSPDHPCLRTTDHRRLSSDPQGGRHLRQFRFTGVVPVIGQR